MSNQTRETLESLLLVTVVTLLVWLYAEGEVVQSHTRSVPVAFVSPHGQQPLVIHPMGEPEADAVTTVDVTFRASAGQMQTVTQATNAGPVEIAVTPPNTPAGDEQTINLRSALANSRLGQLGVNISGTDPPSFTVHVEPTRTIALPIRVDTGDLRLAEPPSVEPLQVKVRVPATFAPQARNGQVIADVDRQRLRELAPNEAHSLEVGLRLPGWLDRPHVSLLSDTARVELTIENHTEQFVVEEVPIHINADITLLQRYRVSLANRRSVLERVTLVGPVDAIERIRRGQFQVWAEVRPTLDQIQSDVETVKLHLHCPEGVRVTSSLPRVGLSVEPTGSFGGDR
jgi:hypothetical protein